MHLVREFDHDHVEGVMPMSMPYIQPVLIPLQDADGQDWAGISGGVRFVFVIIKSY